MQKITLNVIPMVIFTAILCISGVSQAISKIYKTVHADGSITYSDQASQGAIEVELNVPTSTFTSAGKPNSPVAVNKPEEVIARQVTILRPAAEATVRNNQGEILIAAELDSPTGGFFQLNINDQIHESATGIFRLSEMERGAYNYSIKFIDNSGKVIAFSESRNVYLHKTSALIN